MFMTICKCFESKLFFT